MRGWEFSTLWRTESLQIFQRAVCTADITTDSSPCLDLGPEGETVTNAESLPCYHPTKLQLPADPPAHKAMLLLSLRQPHRKQVETYFKRLLDSEYLRGGVGGIGKEAARTGVLASFFLDQSNGYKGLRSVGFFV